MAPHRPEASGMTAPIAIPGRAQSKGGSIDSASSASSTATTPDSTPPRERSGRFDRQQHHPTSSSGQLTRLPQLEERYDFAGDDASLWPQATIASASTTASPSLRRPPTSQSRSTYVPPGAVHAAAATAPWRPPHKRGPATAPQSSWASQQPQQPPQQPKYSAMNVPAMNVPAMNMPASGASRNYNASGVHRGSAPAANAATPKAGFAWMNGGRTRLEQCQALDISMQVLSLGAIRTMVSFTVNVAPHAQGYLVYPVNRNVVVSSASLSDAAPTSSAPAPRQAGMVGAAPSQERAYAEIRAVGRGQHELRLPLAPAAEPRTVTVKLVLVQPLSSREMASQWIPAGSPGQPARLTATAQRQCHACWNTSTPCKACRALHCEVRLTTADGAAVTERPGEVIEATCDTYDNLRLSLVVSSKGMLYDDRHTYIAALDNHEEAFVIGTLLPAASSSRGTHDLAKWRFDTGRHQPSVAPLRVQHATQRAEVDALLSGALPTPAPLIRLDGEAHRTVLALVICITNMSSRSRCQSKARAGADIGSRLRNRLALADMHGSALQVQQQPRGCTVAYGAATAVPVPALVPAAGVASRPADSRRPLQLADEVNTTNIWPSALGTFDTTWSLGSNYDASGTPTTTWGGRADEGLNLENLPWAIHDDISFAIGK